MVGVEACPVEEEFRGEVEGRVAEEGGEVEEYQNLSLLK